MYTLVINPTLTPKIISWSQVGESLNDEDHEDEENMVESL